MIPIALFFALFVGLFYLVALFGYATGLSFVMKHQDFWFPWMSRQGWSRARCIGMMVGCMVGGFAVASLLLLPFPWRWIGVGAVVVVCGEEAYRGATYFLKCGQTGEAVKHMIIHSALAAWTLGYALASAGISF
ncbi:MAG TPA: hypothetical protein VFH53_08690 [Phycisphaerae bacterium]|nr:hypothetical protein [Phycisphaerae bacterium]HUX15639.1 hypothetical protein [Phycisphaerae bacterium]